MSLLDDVGAKIKAALGDNSPGVGIVDKMLAYIHDPQSGGLGGIVQQFENGGLGKAVQSWISTGKNLPVTADQITAALGPDRLAKLAGRLGMTPEQASQRISEVLPQIVDHLTPNGQLPSADELKSKLTGMLSKPAG